MYVEFEFGSDDGLFLNTIVELTRKNWEEPRKLRTSGVFDETRTGYIPKCFHVN